MRDVTVDLAHVLLGDDASARAAADRLAGRADWRRAVALAAAWRVVPALRRRVASLGVDIEAGAGQDLRARGVAAAIQSTALTHRAATVLADLDRAGVAAAAFKGVGLIANLYDGPGQRMVADIDVLINRADLEAARGVLGAAGFSPFIDEPEAFIEFLDRRPHEGAASGNHFLVLKDQDGVEIDLHWRLGARPRAPLAAEHIIARAERATRYGFVFRVAGPIDAIVLTVHHAVRGNFAPDTTVKDLLDLSEWWRAQASRWVVTDVIAQARDCGLAAPLLALWLILADFDPEQGKAEAVADAAARLSPRHRRDGARLRDAFRFQLHHGRVNGDLLRMLSPFTIMRFLIRRWRDREQTARFTAQIETQLGLVPQRSDRERFVRLALELVRLGPRKLMFYRALLRAHRMGRLLPKGE